MANIPKYLIYIGISVALILLRSMLMSNAAHSPDRAPSTGTRQSGFSIIEVLWAMGTFGVLATVAGVSLGEVAPKFALDNGARMVAMALNQARTLSIMRGHIVDVSFKSHSFTITDTDEGANGEDVATGQLPAHLTMAVTGAASFTPLGTVSAPLAVTLSNDAAHDQVVRVSLTGEVHIGESQHTQP